MITEPVSQARQAGRAEYHQDGIGLVELMIAMVLGLLLVAGAIQIFASSKTAYLTDQGLANAQESARFAIRMLTRDVRMAGFTGCVESPNVLLNPAGNNYSETIFDVNQPVGGWNASGTAPGDDYTITTLDPTTASASDWSDSEGDDLYGALADRVVPGTDVLVVKRIGPKLDIQVTGTNPANSAAVNTSDTTDINQNQIVMITQGCQHADIAQKRNNTNSSSVSRGNGSSTNPGPGNINSDWSTSYGGSAEIRRFMSTAYFVGESANDEPALYRTSFDGANGSATTPSSFEEMVPGVETMQVLYGEDTDDDGVPNQYRPANAVSDPETVVAVRLDLIIRTEKEIGGFVDNGPFALSGGTNITTGADRRMRYVVSTTVDLRNK